jgi:uncharacterized protein (DUF362 family)
LNNKKTTRREALVNGAALVAGAAAASCLPRVVGDWPPDGGQAICSWTEPRITPVTPTNGRVIQASNYDMVTLPPSVTIIECQAERTFKEMMLKLTGAADMQAAWLSLLVDYKPGQVVGIKVNALNSKVPTHREVVKVVVDSLKAHVPDIQADDILVWDRRLDELKKAGLTAEYLECRVEGTKEDAQTKGNGRGYELSSICLGSGQSHLTNIQTRAVDHLINFAVLKNHRASGFTGVLKNHYGTIDNPGMFHDKVDANTGKVIERRFEQAIPTINALDEVVTKSRLFLIDASIVVIKGDTDSAADWIPTTLMASLDPVALDAQGRKLRDQCVVDSGSPKPTETISDGWLKVCERVGLGSATPLVVPLDCTGHECPDV